jgi:hypothetical protein
LAFFICYIANRRAFSLIYSGKTTIGKKRKIINPNVDYAKKEFYCTIPFQKFKSGWTFNQFIFQIILILTCYTMPMNKHLKNENAKKFGNFKMLWMLDIINHNLSMCMPSASQW